MATIRENPIRAPQLPKVGMPKATSFMGQLPKPVRPLQGPSTAGPGGMGGFVTKPPKF